MPNYGFIVICAVILSAWVIFGGCTSPPSSSTGPSPSGSLRPEESGQPPAHPAASSGTFTISVDSLSPGSALPDVYTCKGAGESPEVAWNSPPAGTMSLVLLLEDPDAPQGIFTHWLVYNIPPGPGNLSRAQPNAKVLSNEGQQGESSTGFRGYYPPCPPIGPAHRYIFRLYALDSSLTLPTADRAAIDQAIAGHILGKTEFITTFRR